MKKLTLKHFFELTISTIYLLAAFSLLGIGIIILIWAILQCIDVFSTLTEVSSIQQVLQAVGVIIISIALIDVAKYLFEEEIFRNKELRSPAEARKTLTKIFVIISIAVSLEGLVFIFKAGMQSFSDLIYPAVLIFTSILSMVGLGLYQKLSVSAENVVEKNHNAEGQ